MQDGERWVCGFPEPLPGIQKNSDSVNSSARNLTQTSIHEDKGLVRWQVSSFQAEAGLRSRETHVLQGGGRA